jgi:hypothetical protein
MPRKINQKTLDYEDRIQKALLALKNKEFTTLLTASSYFQVSRRTLQRRRDGGETLTRSHEMQQYLTNAEESTLLRWIKRYTITGNPLTIPLLQDLARHIRVARVVHASKSTPLVLQIATPSRQWVYRFLKRHPEIAISTLRQLEHCRKDGASYEHVERWFRAVASKHAEHQYDPSNMYNMDESGFGVGEEQAMKVLIYLDDTTKHSVIGGKQEWVTDIECISAAGEALSPLLIFKGTNVNSRWINEKTPEGWSLATSKNGWTSNDLGLEWLMRIFEPQTREKAAGRQRLLIADGHGSHIRADFIAYCMENDIDLLIMPPHCSHLLQPLDVGVFSAFKRYHTVETHAISRLSSQRIPRSEWIELLSRARSKAMSRENILSGWRATGLWPITPMRVLNGLRKIDTPATPQLLTACATTNLDLSLLKSSPPEPTELSKSNKRFSESLRECPEVVSPVRRYAERMVRMCETQNATIAVQARVIAEQSELLKKRKKAIRGKRVQLEGQSIFSTPEILRVAREAEVKQITKRPRGRPRKVQIIEKDSEDEDEVSDDSIDSFDEEPAPRRRCARFSHVAI